MLNKLRDIFKRNVIQVESKSWSNDLLRIGTENAYSLGQDKVSNPYEQSYAVYRAVRSIAENMPQAEFKIFKGGKEVPETDEVSRLFSRPNSMMSRWELWEAIATYLNYKGECFLYCVPAVGRTLPAQLLPLNPDYIKHVVEGGELVSWVYDVNTVRMPITIDQMIQFKLFNPGNPFRGLSPINAVRNEMETDFAAGRYNKMFFQNNASPDGVVEVDKEKAISLDDLKKIKDMWNTAHQGVSNARKIAFLLGGLTYKNVGVNQKDAEFMEQRRFSLDAVLAVFGVPAFIAGFIGKGEVNRSTANALRRVFWTNTLKPQVLRIQEKIQVEFFPLYAPEYSGKFDFSNIPELRPDLNETLTAATSLINLGYTRNEVNDRLDLQMTTDPDGDIRYMPSSLVAVGDSSDATPAPEEDIIEDDDKTLHTSILNKAKDTFHSEFLTIQNDAEKLVHAKLKRFLFEQRSDVLKKTNDQLSYEQLIYEISEIIINQKTKLKDILQPLYKDVMSKAGEFALSNIYLQRAINTMTVKDLQVNFDVPEFMIDAEMLALRLNMVTGMSDVVFGQLKTQLYTVVRAGGTIQEMQAIIRDVFNVASNRALTIARTETAALINGQQNIIYKNENVQFKAWLTTVDSATRKSHIAVNGEEVPINNKFSNGLMYPGDSSAPPEEVVACRCALMPVVK